MSKRSITISDEGNAMHSNRPSGPVYRFSGHETFACRYSWLPKAFAELSSSPLLFTNEENAMVRLGVGKNMVKSIRF